MGSALPNHNNLLLLPSVQVEHLLWKVKRSTSYQHDSHMNKHTNNYRPWVGPKEVLFCPDLFFFFLFKVHFYSDGFAVCLSYTLFSLGNATRMFFSCSCQWIIQQWVISPTNLTQRQKPLRESLQCSEIIRRKKTHYQQLLVMFFLLSFLSSTRLTWVSLCISFENKAPFWSNDSFLQVLVLFIVSCTCLHCILHCPTEKQY